MNKFCPSCGCWALEQQSYPQEHIYTCAECDQIWTAKGLEAAYESMNTTKKKEMTIFKFRYAYGVPAYVSFGHRHLEKECPSGSTNGPEERFTIPTDLLGVVGIPAELVDEIESISLSYKRKGT